MLWFYKCNNKPDVVVFYTIFKVPLALCIAHIYRVAYFSHFLTLTTYSCHQLQLPQPTFIPQPSQPDDRRWLQIHELNLSFQANNQKNTEKKPLKIVFSTNFFKLFVSRVGHKWPDQLVLLQLQAFNMGESWYTAPANNVTTAKGCSSNLQFLCCCCYAPSFLYQSKTIWNLI